MSSRPRQGRPNRRQFDPSNVPQRTDADAAGSIAAGKARLTFASPVSVAGLFPMRVLGALSTAAAQVGATASRTTT